MRKWGCRILYFNFRELFLLLQLLQYVKNSNSSFYGIIARFLPCNLQNREKHIRYTETETKVVEPIYIYSANKAF